MRSGFVANGGGDRAGRSISTLDPVDVALGAGLQVGGVPSYPASRIPPLRQPPIPIKYTTITIPNKARMTATTTASIAVRGV